MTQSDLFGGQPQQTRLTLVTQIEQVTDGVPVTSLEVWSAAHTKRGSMVGRLEYRGCSHDLLSDDVRYLMDAWQWDTLPNLRRWLTTRSRYLRKYDRKHPWKAGDYSTF